MAYGFLESMGLNECFCTHVKDCITTHRFRTNGYPVTDEAKVLYDADKLDAMGALGIARSLIYTGRLGQPLFTIDSEDQIEMDDDPKIPNSFLKEYHYKLAKIYDSFYTSEAKEIARKRENIMVNFYNELLTEITLDKTAAIRQLYV